MDLPSSVHIETMSSFSLSCHSFYFFVFQNCQALTSLGLESVVQFSSVTHSCPTLCDPMNRSMPGFPVNHQLLESTQSHVNWVSDAIQWFHPLTSSPLALNLSQHQSFFKWVSSSSGGQTIGVSALASVLPMNTQDWSPLGWPGWIS